MTTKAKEIARRPFEQGNQSSFNDAIDNVNSILEDHKLEVGVTFDDDGEPKHIILYKLPGVEVEVTLKVKFNIAYKVAVENPQNPAEIRKALLEKDAADWVSDPDFYEHLGNSYRYYVETTSDDELLKNTRVE